MFSYLVGLTARRPGPVLLMPVSCRLPCLPQRRSRMAWLRRPRHLTRLMCLFVCPLLTLTTGNLRGGIALLGTRVCVSCAGTFAPIRTSISARFPLLSRALRATKENLTALQCVRSVPALTLSLRVGGTAFLSTSRPRRRLGMTTSHTPECSCLIGSSTRGCCMLPAKPSSRRKLSGGIRPTLCGMLPSTARSSCFVRTMKQPSSRTTTPPFGHLMVWSFPLVPLIHPRITAPQSHSFAPCTCVLAPCCVTPLWRTTGGPSL